MPTQPASQQQASPWAAAVASAQQSGASDDDDGDPVYLWPECVDAWGHWQCLQTQWRSSMAGATGLDYAGVRAYLDELGIEPGDERRELFDCFREAERASLEAWDERRTKDAAQQPQR